jgi:CheY-like chemotaxis protein
MPANEFPTGKAIVLVVEDEPLLRMAGVDLVEQAGFEAIEANGADEAILILESRSDIRILFTDIDMPGSMNGLKLAAAVRDRWPPIHIIVASGHHQAKQEELPQGALFFAKPYPQGELIATLQKLAA